VGHKADKALAIFGLNLTTVLLNSEHSAKTERMLTMFYRQQMLLSLSLPEYRRRGKNSLWTDVGDSWPVNCLLTIKTFQSITAN